MAAVLPDSEAQIGAVVRACKAQGVPVVTRGAGTGISGGAVPRHGGLIVSTNRMKRVLEIDPANRCAVVEPGVVNLELSKLTEPYGLFFAPDRRARR
jgi:glycolate oxidase